MKVVGIGTRVLNFLVDTTIIVIFTRIVNSIVTQQALKYKAYNQVYPYNVEPMYIFFAVLFVYYFIGELIFKRTIGKMVSYTKVVTINNTTPNFFQILLRSIIRLTVIDMFFFPFFEKTLHDYLSKTNVVEV